MYPADILKSFILFEQGLVANRYLKTLSRSKKIDKILMLHVVSQFFGKPSVPVAQHTMCE